MLIQSIKTKTKWLLSACDESVKRYQTLRDQERDLDFFEEIKPYADRAFTEIDQWKESCLKWIQKSRPQYVHPQQIETANDMFKQLIVQSFYRKTGKKRFILSVQSVRYTLQSVLLAAEQEEAFRDDESSD